MSPDEVMRLGKKEMVFRTSNRRPMRLEKLYYDEQPAQSEVKALGAARVSKPKRSP